MKYAKLVNKGKNSFTEIRGRINIGDNIQSMAIDRLFRYAGIPQDDILECSYFDSENISEPCCLIVQGHFSRHYNMGFMKNPNICPIFIGFALMDSYLLGEEADYIRKYEPILCRDEFTKNVLKKYGIKAYISGCLSLTFEKRKNVSLTEGKYYFVDIKEKFLKNLPEKVRDNSIFTSQNIAVNYVNEKVMEEGELLAKKQLAEYYQNAKMIITSKLHCMCPSIGMGIPTIAVNDNFSYRYTFVDAFITGYDERTFEWYNWDKKEVVDIEDIKYLLLDVGKSMLYNNPDMEKIQRLDAFYSKRKKWNYCSKIKTKLREIFDGIDRPKFILWGAAAGGGTVYSCIKELYPQAELLEIIDSYTEGIWENRLIKKPEEVIKEKLTVKVIVSTLSGKESAISLLESKGFQRNVDYYIIHESL